ncbi:MAG: glutamate synthase-related protein, partial [Gammaproteobacteria bacterium]
VIDGAEGGTGAAPQEFTDHVGTPLRDSLVFAQNTLVAAGLREQIRLVAAGKIITAFDIARACALGADWCNAARGFMFALGCLQAQTCHTGHCPTGVTTQDPRRYRALDPTDKAVRVFNFHENTLLALRELLGAAGLSHPGELGPEHIIRRISATEVRSLASLHLWLPLNCLRDGEVPEHRVFKSYWSASSPDTFSAPPEVLALRRTKLL